MGNVEVLHPLGTGSFDRELRRPWLRPASWVYAGGVALARRRGLARARRKRALRDSDVRIISVGNLEVGGNGKTPFAMHLLEHITRTGGRGVYLSRGYASVSERLSGITVVPAQGAPPVRSGVRCLSRGSRSLAAEIGDEGAMVARRLTDVPLVLGRDKLAALDLAASALDATHVVMDDAFQSWRVPRDFDVVLLDARRPLDHGHMLPAGTLREHPSALARADLIGLNGVVAAEEVEQAQSRDLPVSFGVVRTLTFVDASGDACAPPDQPAAVLSAVGRPGLFDRAVVAAGVDARLSLRYPDHHHYRGDDVQVMARALSARALGTVITTEKDWVKLEGGVDAVDARFVIARLCVEVIGDVLDQITKPRVGSPAASL